MPSVFLSPPSKPDRPHLTCQISVRVPRISNLSAIEECVKEGRRVRLGRTGRLVGTSRAARARAFRTFTRR